MATSQFSKLAYYQESTSYNKSILQLVNMTSSDYTYQHVYITNDEEPKNGEWVYHPEVSQEYTKVNLSKEGDEKYTKGQHTAQGVYKHKPTTNEWYKKERKIILTTDPELIVDGIQAINDDFLQWFVNNDSCEEVKISHELNINGKNGLDRARFIYKIIIPVEESKQECEYCRQAINKYGCACAKPLKDFKQEELDIKDIEQLAERITTGEGVGQYMDKPPRIANFLLGYKAAKQEVLKKSYSEEDLKNAFDSGREFDSLDGIVDIHIVLPMGGDMSDLQPLYLTFEDWFKNLKSKNENI